MIDVLGSGFGLGWTARGKSVCNDALVARSWLLSAAKLTPDCNVWTAIRAAKHVRFYYRAFAMLYGFCGPLARTLTGAESL